MTETWNAGNPQLTNQVAADIPDIEENFDYLMAMHGYWVDAAESDQGAAGSGNSVKDLVDAIGSSKNASLFFKHNAADGNTTTYTFSTSETIPSNISVYVQNGARLSVGSGQTLTFGGYLHPVPYQIFSGSGTIALSNPQMVYSEMWGAVGDGTTDDSTAIQAAIDCLATAQGGTVQFLEKTYECNLEIKSYVTLAGALSLGYPNTAAGSATNKRPTLIAHGTGEVIDTAVTAVTEPAIIGLNFTGLGAATALKGIYFRNVNRGVIRDCGFDNFADEAIHIADGNANEIYKCIGINILLDTTRAAHTGAIHLGNANETRVIFCEMSGGSALTDANMYNNAYYIGSDGTGNWLISCQGSGMDVGFYIDGDHNHLLSCVADLNWGHGFELSSSAQSNILTSCHAHRNSRETTATYDGFKAGVQSQNIFTGCFVNYNAADGWTHQYGYNDSTANASPTSRNKYIGCSVGSGAASTGDFNFTSGAGIHPILADGGYIAATDADATPSVKGAGLLVVQNTGATTITDFDDAVNGQELTVLILDDGYTTISNSGDTKIRLLAGADIQPAQYSVLSFKSYAGTWFQKGSNGYFDTDTTAAGAGADGTISSRSAVALGECDGFIKLKNAAGTTVYVPYWLDITP